MENAPTAEMTPAEYLKQRIDNQINWYSDKSTRNKRGFYFCQTMVICCGALIPILIGYSDNWNVLKYVAGVLGVLIVVLEGISNLKKYKENWMSYRLTGESLLREKLLYQNQVGEFQDEPYDFKVFVLKCEQIMSGENANWVKTWEKKDSKPDKKDDKKED